MGGGNDREVKKNKKNEVPASIMQRQWGLWGEVAPYSQG